MKVLVSDGHLKTSLSAVRALGRRGVEAHTFSDRRDGGLCALSRYTARAHVLPPYAQPQEFDAAMERLLDRERFDALLIASEGALRRIDANRDAVLSRTRCDLPPPRTVDIVLSKSSLLEHAARLGFPTPRTVFFRGDDPAAAAGIETLRYPVVAKTGERTTYERVRYFNDAGSLRRHLDGFPADETVVVQEYVDGWGYGYFALFEKGRPVVERMHRRIWEFPITGGPSVLAETVEDAALRDLGRRLLESLDWSGLAMVEFKKAREDGRFVLMEINPRLWGSLDLCVASGADFPYLAAAADREEAARDMEPRPAAYLWLLPDAGLYLAARPWHALRFLRYLVSPRVRTSLALDDPRPLLRQARELVYWLRWFLARRSIRHPQGRPEPPEGFAFDLHMHTSASFDSLSGTRRVLRKASRERLAVIALTDHDSIAGGRLAARLADGRRPEVIVGSEVRTDSGDLVGLFLDRDVASRDAIAAAREIHEQGGLVMLPHPFSYGVKAYDERLLDLVDLIELRNGRTRHEPVAKVLEIARARGIPVVGNSDAHFVQEIGVTRNVAESGPAPGESLKDFLRSGRWRIVSRKSPFHLYPLSQAVKALKAGRPVRALFFAWWGVKSLVREGLTATFGRRVG